MIVGIKVIVAIGTTGQNEQSGNDGEVFHNVGYIMAPGIGKLNIKKLKNLLKKFLAWAYPNPNPLLPYL